jgi:hypothetical protein
MWSQPSVVEVESMEWTYIELLPKKVTRSFKFELCGGTPYLKVAHT